ncbi:MAG: TSUP family transporter [Pseudomonadales bacterium]
MDWLGWLIFLGAAFIGSYVQAVTGFAMGMIVIAVAGASGLIGLPVLTAAASIISLVNIVFALKGHTGSLHRPLVFWLALGQIPAIGVGVWLLTVLDRNLQWLLQLLLGGFLIAGCLSMLLRPKPITRVSPPWAALTGGLAGGLIGGLFAASGPVIGWFCYRQPLSLPAIRASLLAFFALTSSSRTLIVGVQGGLTAEVLLLSMVAIPLVVLGTWLGRENPPPVSDEVLKRVVFALLLLMGCWILLGGLLEMGA